MKAFHPLIQEADSLILDIGQVLLRFEPSRILQELVPLADHGLLQQNVFQTQHWLDLDRGSLDIRAACSLMCSAPCMAGQEETVQYLLENFSQACAPLPLSHELARLKAMGKKLYALSNFHRDAFMKVQQAHAFFAHFDGLLISSHEGLLKPEPAIYRLLLSRHGIRPEGAVFIDDVAENLRAAERLGIRGILYRGMDSVLY